MTDRFGGDSATNNVWNRLCVSAAGAVLEMPADLADLRASIDYAYEQRLVMKEHDTGPENERTLLNAAVRAAVTAHRPLPAASAVVDAELKVRSHAEVATALTSAITALEQELAGLLRDNDRIVGLVKPGHDAILGEAAKLLAVLDGTPLETGTLLRADPKVARAWVQFEQVAHRRGLICDLLLDYDLFVACDGDRDGRYRWLRSPAVIQPNRMAPWPDFESSAVAFRVYIESGAEPWCPTQAERAARYDEQHPAVTRAAGVAGLRA